MRIKKTTTPKRTHPYVRVPSISGCRHPSTSGKAEIAYIPGPSSAKVSQSYIRCDSLIDTIINAPTVMSYVDKIAINQLAIDLAKSDHEEVINAVAQTHACILNDYISVNDISRNFWEICAATEIAADISILLNTVTNIAKWVELRGGYDALTPAQKQDVCEKHNTYSRIINENADIICLAEDTLSKTRIAISIRENDRIMKVFDTCEATIDLKFWDIVMDGTIDTLL